MTVPHPRLLVLPLLASLTIAGGFALSGCDTADKVASAADPVSEAIAATNKADGARFRMRIAFSGPAMGVDAAVTADGVTDLRGGNAQLTMDLGPLSALGGGKNAPSASDMKMEMRLVDRKLFLRSAILAGQLPAGKSWLGADLEEIAHGLGIDPSQFQQLSDPTQVLQYLRDAGSVTEVGSEQVDGVTATRYRAVIDMEKVLGAFTGTGSGRREMRDLLRGMLPKDGLPADVWIGDDGLLRRMEMRLALGEGATQAAGAGGIGMTMRLDLSDYGTKVSVAAPPASEVADGAKLFGLSGNATP